MRTQGRRVAGAASSSKPPKAKHPSNQEALDKLHKMRQDSMAANSHFARTLKRAMNSLAASEEAITTRAQAMALKGVGAHLTKTIIKNQSSSNSTSSADEKENQKTGGGARKRPRKTASSANTTSPSAASVDPGKRPTLQQKQQCLLSRDKITGSISCTVPVASTSSTSATRKMSAKKRAYSKTVQASLEFNENVGSSSSTVWEVVFLLDGRERKADHVCAKLQMSGIPCEIRHLPIGDMAWIARQKTPTPSSSAECVEILLGTIVERKTLADLAASLFGTRYMEQRLRLSNIAQNCGQIIFLIERADGPPPSCPMETLKTAMMESMVHLNFHILETEHLDGSVRALKRLHRRVLQRTFPSAFLSGEEEVVERLPTFQSPDAVSSKGKKYVEKVGPFTGVPTRPRWMKRWMTYTELKAQIEWERESGTRSVGAVHKAMLQQVTGVSHKKVEAVAKEYPTVQSLMSALATASTEQHTTDATNALQALETTVGGVRSCLVGQKTAENIVQTYTVGEHANNNSCGSEPLDYRTRGESTCVSKTKNDGHVPESTNLKDYYIETQKPSLDRRKNATKVRPDAKSIENTLGDKSGKIRRGPDKRNHGDLSDPNFCLDLTQEDDDDRNEHDNSENEILKPSANLYREKSTETGKVDDEESCNNDCVDSCDSHEIKSIIPSVRTKKRWKKTVGSTNKGDERQDRSTKPVNNLEMIVID